MSMDALVWSGFVLLSLAVWVHAREPSRRPDACVPPPQLACGPTVLLLGLSGLLLLVLALNRIDPEMRGVPVPTPTAVLPQR